MVGKYHWYAFGKSCVLPSLPWHDSWFEIDVATHFWSNPKFKRCRLWRDVGIFDTQHVAEWEMLATFSPLLKALRISTFQQLPDFRISPMSPPMITWLQDFPGKLVLSCFLVLGGGGFHPFWQERNLERYTFAYCKLRLGDAVTRSTLEVKLDEQKSVSFGG